MSVYEITLTGFKFPKNLDNDKANFRFVVDLRFVNDESRFTTEHAVMPSLDTFWECDQGGARASQTMSGVRMRAITVSSTWMPLMSGIG